MPNSVGLNNRFATMFVLNLLTHENPVVEKIESNALIHE